MFFTLQPMASFLSDVNEDLIECYRRVRDDPKLVHRYLSQHASQNCDDYYYKIRDQYNSSKPSTSQAARFIYLNRTCFNGIFRVNEKGEYNVPYGYKKSPVFPSCDELQAISKLLSYTTLESGTFDEVLEKNQPPAGDFVYLDPPYPPLNGTSYFTHYTASRFSWDDQEKVARMASQLTANGVLVMVSNANLESIRNLYSQWFFYPLPVVRWIAAHGKRYKVSELVITNYPVQCDYSIVTDL